MDQQIVLITGAAGRLGKAFSKSIVESGGNVFLIDVDEEQGQRLVIELGMKQAKFLVADITTVAGIQQSIQACVAQFGKVDAVVHAAYPHLDGMGCDLRKFKA